MPLRERERMVFVVVCTPVKWGKWLEAVCFTLRSMVSSRQATNAARDAAGRRSSSEWPGALPLLLAPSQ